MRADESWAEAADRLAAGIGPVLAVDLSGDPLRFQVDDEHRFALRPMTEGDLADVTRWINAPHVVAVVGREPVARSRSPPTTARGSAVRTPSGTGSGRSTAARSGFCQDYRIADHPEYALLCGRPDAIGFDYVIGEAAFVDRGLGTSLLWVFLRDIVVPAYDGATELFAAPDHRNARLAARAGQAGRDRGRCGSTSRSPDGRVDTVVGCSIDVQRVLRWA